MCMVPQQLRERLEDFFENENENETAAYPRIRVINEEDLFLEIVLEGLVICRCGDYTTEFALWMAVYYSFNLAYPNKLRSSLTFFQKAFLGLNDATKDSKVSSLICKLCA